MFNSLSQLEFNQNLQLTVATGMAESAFFPLVIYYLTTFYRRGELARRLALFYAASNIANAFSGLLSFGVFQIESSLDSWRYLFIIEGSLTVICKKSSHIPQVLIKIDHKQSPSLHTGISPKTHTKPNS